MNYGNNITMDLKEIWRGDRMILTDRDEWLAATNIVLREERRIS
jgi:hypothetical protein